MGATPQSAAMENKLEVPRRLDTDHQLCPRTPTLPKRTERHVGVRPSPTDLPCPTESPIGRDTGEVRVSVWARVALALTLVVITGCAGGDDSRPPGRVGVAYEVVLRCEDVIDRIAEPPAEYRDVAGVMALPTGDAAPHPIQVNDTRGPDPASRYFAKTGLLVWPQREFAVVVPEAYHDRVAIGWGNPGTETHRLLVPPCPAEQDEWLVFAGGISVANPECIELEVVSGTTTERFTVGVGEPCPGQEP